MENDRPIGHIIKESKKLSDKNVEQILKRQRERGIRFGEAAVELDMADRDDVMWALSQQFRYPYATVSGHGTSKELIVAANPFGEQAEAFRELRSQLIMGALAPKDIRRSIAVVSPEVGDGKTFIAANLAVAFSQLGVHTLLIDLDMRTPRQHELFDVDNSSGLSNILSGRTEGNVIRPVATLPTLFVLPVGTVPPNPIELIQGPAFGLLMRELMTKFDYVVVDTPAASHGADARVVAAQCGAVLAVGREGRSSLRSMQKLLGQIGKGPAVMAGVVINER